MSFFLEDVITDNKIAGTKATLILPKKEKKKKNQMKKLRTVLVDDEHNNMDLSLILLKKLSLYRNSG